jgi:hypothetical protein
MKSLVKNGLMFFAGILILATSCTTMNESEEKSGKGTVVLKLTDAPFPVSLVDKTIVNVDKIEIHGTTASSTTESGTVTPTSEEDENEDASNYIVLSEETQQFDLLKLQNGITTELLKADLEVGTYDMIRLHITDAKVILKDGTEFALKIPGGTSSGLKIMLSPKLIVEDGSMSEIILDFDVSKSFVVQGNPKTPAGIKGFLFKPVVRGMCENYSGSIAGKVFENETTPIAGAHVKVIKGTEEITSAISATDGTYAIIGLPAGTYSMTCEAEGYISVAANPVIVKAKQKTIQDFKLSK